MAEIVLKSNPIEKDGILEELSQNFDYEFSGVSETCVPTLEELPKDFQIGLIVGPSGSGKSTMLKLFNEEKTPVWSESKAIASHFDSARYIKSNDIHSMVFASCHYDIIEWLEPDWVFDTLTQKYLSRGLLWRAKIELEVVPCSALAWSIFSKHHYLSANLNKSAKHWMCSWDGTPVAFTSVIAMPSGTLKNAFRGHRTVVFPDYQGLGIGVRLSDAIGQIYVSEGKRYFSKTTHPRMGAYRNASNKWKATSKNMRVRGDFGGNKNIEWEPRKVFSYSHEFIGG